MNTKITYLKNHPEHIALLAQWEFTTWGHYYFDANIDKTNKKMIANANDHQLPLTYIALNEDKPIGMASLLLNDGIRPDLMPWLASLFVVPENRNEGIGEKLIKMVIQKANDLGFSNLYLLAFEPTLPNWYQKFGWQTISMDKLDDNPVTVMELKINQTGTTN